MVKIFDASNSVEAHFILNLLNQAELDCRIDGEFLQGGIGELQPLGLVRVMVEESDYDEAKAIIDAWDSSYRDPRDVPGTSSGNSLGPFEIGFLVVALSALILFGIRIV